MDFWDAPSLKSTPEGLICQLWDNPIKAGFQRVSLVALEDSLEVAVLAFLEDTHQVEVAKEVPERIQEVQEGILALEMDIKVRDSWKNPIEMLIL